MLLEYQKFSLSACLNSWS